MESVTIKLPNRPVTTVHKGWVPSKKRSNIINSVPAVNQPRFETHTFSISSRKGKSSAANPPEEETLPVSQSSPNSRQGGTSRRIDFVNNASEPLHTKDAAVRRLVRSHAMKEVARKRREQRKTKLKDADAECEKAKGANEMSSPSERPVERLSGDDVVSVPPARGKGVLYVSDRSEIDFCFTDYLSKTQADRRRLASLYSTHIGSAMFPMEFHLAYNPPMQLSALDSSITDDAMFQSLFYAKAVCSTLAEGNRNSIHITAQMSRTIWLINRLLDGGMCLADGMLGAVCNLAMGEVSTMVLVRNET